MPAKITFWGGVGEVGGNQFLLEDTLEGRTVRILLDFGMNFENLNKYYKFPYSPKKHSALRGFLEAGVYPLFPDLNGIYREDYLVRVNITRKEQATLDGVILSHAHLDHAAGIHFLRPDIPVWMSSQTKRILWNIERTSGSSYSEFLYFTYLGGFAPHPKKEGELKLVGDKVSFPRDIKVFSPFSSGVQGAPFFIGHVRIDPYLVDHSVPGATAFIIHTSSGVVVYTGDLRFRGRRPEDTVNFMNAARDATPDYLLMEGTHANTNHHGSEIDVTDEILKVIKDRNGLVVTSYPARDLDRLLSWYCAAKRSGRYLVIDGRQANLLALMDGENGYPRLGHNKYLKVFMPKKGAGYIDTRLHDELAEEDYYKCERKFFDHKDRISAEDVKQNPENFILFMTKSVYDSLMDFRPPPGSIYIKSTTEPFNEEMAWEDEQTRRWLNRFNLDSPKTKTLFDPNGEQPMIHIHTKGHVNKEEAARLLDTIRPKVFVPVHLEEKHLVEYASRAQSYGGKAFLIWKPRAVNGLNDKAGEAHGSHAAGTGGGNHALSALGTNQESSAGSSCVNRNNEKRNILDLETGELIGEALQFKGSLDRDIPDKLLKRHMTKIRSPADTEFVDIAKLIRFMVCPYSHVLDRYIKETNLPISGFAARGMRYNHAIASLIPEEDEEGMRRIFVGPNLDFIGYLRGEELASYLAFKSPESFGAAMKERWRRAVTEGLGQVHNRDMVWGYKNQWHKEGINLEKRCQGYYRFIMEHGLPISDASEPKIAFFHDHKKYILQLGMVMPGMTLGKLVSDFPSYREMQEDTEITLKILAYCTLAHVVRAYRMKWGIEDRRAAEWDGHNVYIDPDVKYVFYDVSTGKSRETHRSDADLPAMKQAIDQAVIMMQSCYKKKDFPPYHKSCSICKYNVLDLVGDPVCKKRNPNIEVMKRRSEFEETVTPPTLP